MLGSSKDGPHWQLWSLFQTFARFIAELFCHQLVLPWLKHGFKKDKSLPWTNIKTINQYCAYCACVCLSTCMLLCAMGHSWLLVEIYGVSATVVVGS